jgi:hypothetical protein
MIVSVLVLILGRIDSLQTISSSRDVTCFVVDSLEVTPFASPTL